MSSEDANDVAKALAAFGAPSIRYHSFGQGRPKVGPVPAVPPDVVKPAVVPAAPAPFSPPLLRQAEPEAAPEPFLPSPAAAPRQTVPPLAPAFRRTIDQKSMATPLRGPSGPPGPRAFMPVRPAPGGPPASSRADSGAPGTIGALPQSGGSAMVETPPGSDRDSERDVARGFGRAVPEVRSLKEIFALLAGDHTPPAGSQPG